MKTLMRAAAIAVLCLMTAACVSAPDADQAENIYPAACSQKATDAVTTPMMVVPLGSPLLPDFHNGKTTYGYAHSLPNGAVWLLAISDALAGWRRKDLIRHERCHVIVGAWHD